MSRDSRPWATWLGVLCLGGSLVFVTGCPPSGEQGSSSLDSASDLPGTVITIIDVKGPFGIFPPGPGTPISVTFTLETGEGGPLPLNELSFFQVFVSGPTTGYQRVIVPQGDVIETAVVNQDGSYTYLFAEPLPGTYQAPANDSATFGSEVGEMSGEPLAPGTYTVGMNAFKTFSINGEDFRDAGNATFNFLLGGATVLEHREVVLRSNCNECHRDLRLHGGIRRETSLCVLCHVAGAEDRISEDPAKATPDVTIEFRRMIHRIHKGTELRRVKATTNGADPYRHEIIGFNETLFNFSDIQFPRMPGGTGFNEQTRNCEACHGGAAQGSSYFANPSRIACGGCHDDVNFADGTKLNPDDPAVAAGTLTAAELNDPAHRIAIEGMPGQSSDDNCIGCHAPGSSLGADVVHKPRLLDETLTSGIVINIDGVAGATGPAGAFLPGDTPVVTFHIMDRNGNFIDIGNLAANPARGINALMSGPTGNYQHIIPAASTTLSVRGSGGVPASGTGPFAYTFAEPIPATYPPPLNDSAAFDSAGGWGELQGQALVDGTYTIAMYAYQEIVVGETTFRESSLPAIADVRVGSSGPLVPHPEIVNDTSCNACHGNLRLHGNTRRGVKLCVLCHASGAEDRVPTDPEAPEPDTIDFKVMIHKIHKGRELDVVQQGGAFDVVGFGGSVIDFSAGLLPAMPGGAKHCDRCHGDSNAWKVPTERSDLRIWMKVCTSCHDSATALAHVNAQTFMGQESCAVCHGEDSEFSVERVHMNR